MYRPTTNNDAFAFAFLYTVYMCIRTNHALQSRTKSKHSAAWPWSGGVLTNIGLCRLWKKNAKYAKYYFSSCTTHIGSQTTKTCQGWSCIIGWECGMRAALPCRWDKFALYCAHPAAYKVMRCLLWLPPLLVCTVLNVVKGKAGLFPPQERAL